MTLTTKGQVTIPIEIRQALGLLPGTQVAFDIVGTSVRIRKAVDSNVILDVLTGDVEWLDWPAAALPEDCLLRQPLPWEAAFLAGRSFVRYRRKGGQRRSPLPDFYIGAHALVGGLTLLTRDPRRYRSYLPALRIIAP